MTSDRRIDVGEDFYNLQLRHRNRSAANAGLTETEHAAIGGNPHDVTLTEVVAADAGTDVTPAELEILTSGGLADSLHGHILPSISFDDLENSNVSNFPADKDIIIRSGANWINRPLVETDVSDLGTYLDESAHDALAADNPHSVTLAQALTADVGTTATTAEIEELTDGSNIIETASTGHHHKGTGILKLARDNAYETFTIDCKGDVASMTATDTNIVMHRTIIPGGLPGPNGQVRVRTHWETDVLPTANFQYYVFIAAGVSATTPGMHIGSVSQKYTSLSTTNILWNQNNESIQRLNGQYYDKDDWDQSTTDWGDVGAIDTSADWSIVWRGRITAADAGKTLYLRSISVEILISPDDI